MLCNRALIVALLVWLTVLGAAPALLKSNSRPAPVRPEPIEVEPETLTAGSGPASLG